MFADLYFTFTLYFTLFLIYIRMFLKIVHVYWYTFFSRENHLYIGYCWTEDSQIQRGGFVLDIFYHNHCSIAIQSISVVWNHSVVILMTIFFSISDLILGTLQFFRHLSAASCVVYRQFFRNLSEEIPGPEGLGLDFTNFLHYFTSNVYFWLWLLTSLTIWPFIFVCWPLLLSTEFWIAELLWFFSLDLQGVAT